VYYTAVEQENAPASVLVALQLRSDFAVVDDALKDRAAQDALVLHTVPAHRRNLCPFFVVCTLPRPAASPSVYVSVLAKLARRKRQIAKHAA
jgi:hypothetical protein